MDGRGSVSVRTHGLACVDSVKPTLLELRGCEKSVRIRLDFHLDLPCLLRDWSWLCTSLADDLQAIPSCRLLLLQSRCRCRCLLPPLAGCTLCARVCFFDLVAITIVLLVIVIILLLLGVSRWRLSLPVSLRCSRWTESRGCGGWQCRRRGHCALSLAAVRVGTCRRCGRIPTGKDILALKREAVSFRGRSRGHVCSPPNRAEQIMNADTDTATQPAPGGAASDGQDRIAPPLLSDIETARSAFKASILFARRSRMCGTGRRC